MFSIKRYRQIHCPNCHSSQISKNGINATGKQNDLCNACRRQFVIDPLKSVIDDHTQSLIDRWLLESISLAGIARSTGVSERWLQSYGNDKDENISWEVIVKARTPGRLTLECDELWSFVVNKEKTMGLHGA